MARGCTRSDAPECLSEERRAFPVIEVLAATEKFAQPHLLEAKTETVPTAPLAPGIPAPGTATVIGPFPRSD